MLLLRALDPGLAICTLTSLQLFVALTTLTAERL